MSEASTPNPSTDNGIAPGDKREYALRLGDNALILGQRLSEWCGHGPFLEEDIALTNLSLDLIGQAQLLLELAAQQRPDGTYTDADQLAYLRDAHEFRNALLTEQPNGDFAHTMLRQYLMDVHDEKLYAALTTSRWQQLADIASKTLKEIRYHKQHSGGWLQRLGQGTEESHARLQKALDDLWFYTPELFEVDALNQRLHAAGIAPDMRELEKQWRAEVESALQRAGLELPASGWVATGGKKGHHSEHLGYILAEMQFLQRAYPGCEW